MQERDWTKYEIDVLRVGYCQRYDLDDIASVLNRTVNAVKIKARKLGFKRPRVGYAKYN